ncbi:prefoldin subunit 2 [Aspergillus eucalypticola CBS 122712]|uniref:Prefoldin subunit 2 n=1 Tax=Aspergillus eucalypticola (strain CBS 122712 / IBT 29274) TaxID=1448314 RepID=A0A317VQ36_ASPEC|nr:prefoldin subunit 2 [Aspergillus eucalypticola CBS 122712]PWY73970.1 prefoldin subunit 2 [Aspergillus eucalypticola CBS 122712]
MASQAQVNPKRQQELQLQYSNYKNTLQQLAQKIGDIEQEAEEHKLVIETLDPLPKDRKCFRMVNGVLVERTVEDVLPSLKTNSDGLKQVLEELLKQYKSKQTDLDNWKVGRLFSGKEAHCINCQRLGHSCTFDFARSRKVKPKQDLVRPSPSTNSNELPQNPLLGFGSPDGYYQAGTTPPGDTLVPGLNLNEGHDTQKGHDDIMDLYLVNRMASDFVPPVQVSSEAQTSVRSSLTDRVSYAMPLLAGSSLTSPVRLLNSKLDATILDDRLGKIYHAIITGCASRFVDYDCNLYATASRYRLEGWSEQPSQRQTPATLDTSINAPFPDTPASVTPLDAISSPDSGMPLNDLSRTFTVIGAVRFLDHFAGLYGNRISVTARKQSDAALKSVLRTFSLQWLPTESRLAGDSILQDSVKGIPTSEAPQNAFYDSWSQTKEVLEQAQSVRSFRVVYAILLFGGITVPTKAPVESTRKFLDSGLQSLCPLNELVRKHCTTLGAHSIYSGLLEASLNAVHWGGYIRDLGASLTINRPCRLPIPGHTKVLFSTGSTLSTFDWSNNQNLPPGLDDSIPSICKKAVAEAFYICRQIVETKNSLCCDQSLACIEDVTSTMATLNNFDKQFRPFINYCINNLECLSLHSRTASVSLVLFWDLSILILAEAVALSRGSGSVDDTIITNMRSYQAEAVASVTKTVDHVLSLPPDSAFNLENGLDAEVPLIAYHITPSLTAMVYQKTIETLMDSQQSPLHTGETADEVWQRQVDIVLKGLSSLGETVGGSEATTRVLQSLLPRYGDILSECWTSDFST